MRVARLLKSPESEIGLLTFVCGYYKVILPIENSVLSSGLCANSSVLYPDFCGYIHTLSLELGDGVFI